MQRGYGLGILPLLWVFVSVSLQPTGERRENGLLQRDLTDKLRKLRSEHDFWTSETHDIEESTSTPHRLHS